MAAEKQNIKVNSQFLNKCQENLKKNLQYGKNKRNIRC